VRDSIASLKWLREREGKRWGGTTGADPIKQQQLQQVAGIKRYANGVPNTNGVCYLALAYSPPNVDAKDCWPNNMQPGVVSLLLRGVHDWAAGRNQAADQRPCTVCVGNPTPGMC